MKPSDVKLSTYIGFNKEHPKFEVGDEVKMSKSRDIFRKIYVAIWSEGGFVITKVKSTVSWTYFVSNLNVEEIVKSFDE